MKILIVGAGAVGQVEIGKEKMDEKER